MAALYFASNENPQYFETLAEATATTLNGFLDGVGSVVYINEAESIYYVDNEIADLKTGDVALDDGTGSLRLNDKQFLFQGDAGALSGSAIGADYVSAFGGQHTTVGGAAAEAITVTGAIPTDLAFVQMVDQGTNVVTALIAVVTADTLTVTFSADPGADAIVNYQLLRAA